MDSSPKQAQWTAQRIVFELLAIWFGSVHAFSTVSFIISSVLSTATHWTASALLNYTDLCLQTITFAIHDLCLHPKYVEPLRKELQSSEYTLFEQTGKGLPLIDSFLKESARLTPAESSKYQTNSLSTNIDRPISEHPPNGNETFPPR